MTVIVNGFSRDIDYRVCTRCVHDSTVPGIEFDSEGVCNYCHIHDQMCQDFPNDEFEGKARLEKIITKIKKAGKDKKYDCVVGLSGGRDSSYLLYCAVKKWGLRPLAVHFNDGFDNPVAGENMAKLTRYLGVEFRTITSNWKQAKDLKIAELKASTPQLNTGTDVGIGAALYGVAAKERLKYILFGQSFRTEGIKPLSWAYFEGDYLRDIHRRFGESQLDPWRAESPGYHLGAFEMAYYVFVRGIRVVAPFYNYNYVRKEAEEVMTREFDWVYPGAHYYDDLYWSLIVHIHRTKFNIDLRRNSYAALVRCQQMQRDEALELLNQVYVIEDPDVIRLCLKRLDISREQFDEWMARPPKHFTDYKNNYRLLRRFRWLILFLVRLGFFPKVVYDKWFTIGTGIDWARD